MHSLVHDWKMVLSPYECETLRCTEIVCRLPTMTTSPSVMRFIGIWKPKYRRSSNRHSSICNLFKPIELHDDTESTTTTTAMVMGDGADADGGGCFEIVCVCVWKCFFLRTIYQMYAPDHIVCIIVCR